MWNSRPGPPGGERLAAEAVKLTLLASELSGIVAPIRHGVQRQWLCRNQLETKDVLKVSK